MVGKKISIWQIELDTILKQTFRKFIYNINIYFAFALSISLLSKESGSSCIGG